MPKFSLGYRSINTFFTQALRALRTAHPFVLDIVIFLLFGGLLYAWQSYVLPAQKGLYSPFQNGLSFIRYIGLMIILNTGISVSSYKRNALWVYIPLLANFCLIAFSAYYIAVILHTGA